MKKNNDSHSLWSPTNSYLALVYLLHFTFLVSSWCPFHLSKRWGQESGLHLYQILQKNLKGKIPVIPGPKSRIIWALAPPVISNVQYHSSPPWHMPETVTLRDLLVDNFTAIFHCICAKRNHPLMELNKSKPICTTVILLHNKRGLENGWRSHFDVLFKPVVFSSIPLYDNSPKPRQEHKAAQLKSLHVQTGLWHTALQPFGGNACKYSEKLQRGKTKSNSEATGLKILIVPQAQKSAGSSRDSS